MVPYLTFLKIKDNYCISYFGLINEFILQLLYIKPEIEAEFPELKLYISCKDEIIENFKFISDEIIPLSKLSNYHFMHNYKISFNNVIHPILKLIKDSNLKLKNLNPIKINQKNNICTIVTKATSPFKSLTNEQINKAIQYAQNRGFNVNLNENIDENIEQAEWVIGCESENFYKAGILGSKLILIPTNNNEELFQRLFPMAEIFFN